MTKTDLFDLYQKIISLVNSAQGGFIRPQTNFENWINTINTELFRDMFSEYEKAQQLSDEYKLPFLKTKNAIVTSVPGAAYDEFLYPADYEYFSSARIIRRKDGGGGACGKKGCDFIKDTDKDGRAVNYRWDDPDMLELRALAEQKNLGEAPVELIDNQNWASVLEHETKGPTEALPYITQIGGGFRIAPAGIGIVVLDYLRTPGKAIFSVTPGPGDTVIYNKPGSQQLEWSSIVENELLSRAAMKFGIYTRNEDVSKNAAIEYQIAHK